MDITNKVASLQVVEKSFTPDGESRAVKYSRLVLTLNVKGDAHELTLPGKVSDEFRALLAAADDVDSE